MRKVVVTGAQGFIGKNLCSRIEIIPYIQVIKIDRNTSKADALEKIKDADFIFHLAGVNRTDNKNEYENINSRLTLDLYLERLKNPQKFVFVYTSSTQADLDNPYGKSKMLAETLLQNSLASNAKIIVYQLPGIFGKWSKPNYNSVVSTFCYNVANDISLFIRDEFYELEIAYIDDVIDSFLSDLEAPHINSFVYKETKPTYHISLGVLSNIISSFKEARKSLVMPNLSEDLIKKLYSTYLSYLPENEFSNSLELKSDERGTLFEFIKSPFFGQIFVSVTYPGITRGNHFHHTKTEKFLVIKGTGIIRFRKIGEEKIIEYNVSGREPKVVDIPPGYTHNITNIGCDEMITLFWSNEIFNPTKPDTYFLTV